MGICGLMMTRTAAMVEDEFLTALHRRSQRLMILNLCTGFLYQLESRYKCFNLCASLIKDHACRNNEQCMHDFPLFITMINIDRV